MQVQRCAEGAPRSAGAISSPLSVSHLLSLCTVAILDQILYDLNESSSPITRGMAGLTSSGAAMDPPERALVLRVVPISESPCAGYEQSLEPARLAPEAIHPVVGPALVDHHRRTLLSQLQGAACSIAQPRQLCRSPSCDYSAWWINWHNPEPPRQAFRRLQPKLVAYVNVALTSSRKTGPHSEYGEEKTKLLDSVHGDPNLPGDVPGRARRRSLGRSQRAKPL